MLGFSALEIIAILSTIWVAYIIFGIAGFGTALVAAPILAFFMPVAQIVPLLAILDMSAALSNLLRDGHNAQTSELKRLIPLMLLGSLIGAAILLKGKPEILLLALGGFAVLYALYALSGIKPQSRYQPIAAAPFGLIGGIFSALFGSGGFIYAIYLAGRIDNKESLRVTQSTLIGVSTLTRVVLFAIAGVYADATVLLLALLMAPAMFIGVYMGRRITLNMSRVQFMQVTQIVILCSGLMLLMRYFTH